MTIFLIITTIIFWIFSIYITYIGGMSRAYKNLMTGKQTSFTGLDAAIYENLSGKKLKDIDPIVQMTAELKLKEFKDKMKISKRKKATKKIRKKLTNKSSKNIKK